MKSGKMNRHMSVVSPIRNDIVSSYVSKFPCFRVQKAFSQKRKQPTRMLRRTELNINFASTLRIMFWQHLQHFALHMRLQKRIKVIRRENSISASTTSRICMIIFVPFINESRYDSFSSSAGRSSISFSISTNPGSTGQVEAVVFYTSNSSAAVSCIPSSSKLF